MGISRLNYSRIYAEFIADRASKQGRLSGYTERHHIIPKSMGGSDVAGNLVRLTPEDHIFAHLLLARWNGTKEAWASVKFIFGQSKRLKKTPTRRELLIAAMARREFAQRNSGPANCNFGKPLSAERKERLRKMNIGKKQSPEQVEKHRQRIAGNQYAKGSKRSQEQIRRMSEANMGRRHSDETRLRISRANSGKPKSATHRRRLSAAKRGRPVHHLHTAEVRAKRGAILRGRFVSEATRHKQSLARIGLKASADTRRKMSEQRIGAGNSRAKQITCFTTGEVFGCVKDAAERHGMNYQTLRSAINRNEGRPAICGGLHFGKNNATTNSKESG